MTSIVVTVCEAQAHAEKTGKLTTNMVGVPVSFSFDGAWEGLHKFAVFRCGKVVRDRSLILSDSTTVPHEVLHMADEHLFVGVEGRAPDGALVLPTIWADAGVVLEGANATGVRGEDPTPDAYDDIMAAIKSGILRGPEGPQGPKGDTPVKGVDYHTLEDREDLIETVTSRVITRARNINIGKLTVNERLSIADLVPDDWQNAMKENDNLAEFAKWIYERANIDIGYHIQSVESTFGAMFDTLATGSDHHKLLERTEASRYKLAMLVPGSYGGSESMASHGYRFTMEKKDYRIGDIFCARFSKKLANGSTAENCDYMAVWLGAMFLAYTNCGAGQPAEICYSGVDYVECFVNGLIEECTPNYYYVLRPENISAEEAFSVKQSLLQAQEEMSGLAGAICNTACGETISVSDASVRMLSNLVLYGKTTQDGTPTPDAPIELVSAGGSGSIKVTITGGTGADIQSMAVSTPNGLPGIPVTTGGNYTDASGQQWTCDEIDFARGVYVQRVKSVVLDDTLDYNWLTAGAYSNGNKYVSMVFTDTAQSSAILCNCYEPTGWANVPGKAYCSGHALVMTDNRFTDRETAIVIITEMKPHFLYVLADPIETNLSSEGLEAYAALHTNKPNTTIYTDSTAGVKMEYVADTKTYIDNKFAELAAAIVANA